MRFENYPYPEHPSRGMRKYIRRRKAEERRNIPKGTFVCPEAKEAAALSAAKATDVKRQHGHPRPYRLS